MVVVVVGATCGSWERIGGWKGQVRKNTKDGILIRIHLVIVVAFLVVSLVT